MRSTPRPPFQVLVMSEESRLGREQIETAYLLKQLITAGVRVFYYLEDRERTLDSPTEKLLLSVATFADEMERVKARARTRDAMVRKARAGHVAGGRKYGYDNVDGDRRPTGSRSHVDRRINEAEAAVVRRIFELAGAGYGFRRIAHALNAEAAPAPRASRAARAAGPRRRSGMCCGARSIAASSSWGRTQKRDGWGQRQRGAPLGSARLMTGFGSSGPTCGSCRRPCGHGVQEAPPPDRAAYLRSSNGRLHGARVNGIAAKYLLTGMAVCGQCGGP